VKPKGTVIFVAGTVSAIILLFVSALSYNYGYRKALRSQHGKTGNQPNLTLPAGRSRDRGTASGEPFKWSAIESSNYVTYIENMRAVGVPEETIRDIIKSDVAGNYDRELHDLRNNASPSPYWRDDAPKRIPDNVTRRIRAIVQEKGAILRELLGISVDEDQEYATLIDAFEGTYSFVAPERRQILVSLEQKFQKELMTRGLSLPAIDALREEARFFENWESSIRNSLTEPEFRQWELRLSYSARNIRSRFGRAALTEEEYTRLVDAQRAADLEKRNALLSGGASEATQTAAVLNEDQIVGILGADKYEALKSAYPSNEGPAHE